MSKQKFFTVVHWQRTDGDTIVMPFVHAFTTLRAAKKACKEVLDDEDNYGAEEADEMGEEPVDRAITWTASDASGGVTGIPDDDGGSDYEEFVIQRVEVQS